MSAEFPYLLVTGRRLYQFNAATMTGRTPNRTLQPEDLLDLSPADAERLGIAEGDRVRVTSRHGAAELPAHVDPGARPGEAFTTFHGAAAFINRVIGPGRDPFTRTPEYKVAAVALERVRSAGSNRRLEPKAAGAIPGASPGRVPELTVQGQTSRPS